MEIEDYEMISKALDQVGLIDPDYEVVENAKALINYVLTIYKLMEE